jgi:hypothetical protein
VEKSKKRLFLTVQSNPDVKMGKCQIEISEKEQAKVLSSSKAKEGDINNSILKGEETASQKLMAEMNVTSNDSLLKHISHNNEIIARVLRELDDKSESLK